MYKCKKCGNTERFDELNTIKTSVLNGEATGDGFIERADVICADCGATYEEGEVCEIISDLPELHTNILTEISEFCANECGSREQCCEEECILFRIENLVLEDS